MVFHAYSVTGIKQIVCQRHYIPCWSTASTVFTMRNRPQIASVCSLSTVSSPVLMISGPEAINILFNFNSAGNTYNIETDILFSCNKISYLQKNPDFLSFYDRHVWNIYSVFLADGSQTLLQNKSMFFRWQRVYMRIN